MKLFDTRFRRVSDRWRASAGAFCRNEAGVSAIEFGLFAPILFFSLIATADIGLAVYERMTIDHVLRAGAQSAIVNQNEEAVLQVLKSTASMNFVLADDTNLPDEANVLSVSVERYCACPNATSTAVACSTTCPGPSSTFIFSRMSAEKTYEGMILPSFSLSRSMEVQIR